MPHASSHGIRLGWRVNGIRSVGRRNRSSACNPPASKHIRPFVEILLAASDASSSTHRLHRTHSGGGRMSAHIPYRCPVAAPLFSRLRSESLLSKLKDCLCCRASRFDSELRIHDQRRWTRRRRGHRDGLPRQNAARRCAATRAGFARAAVIAIIVSTLVARSASLFLASLLLALSRWRRKLC